MKKIEIRNNTYELTRNDNECFDFDLVSEKITDYFDDYDYILGDFAYEKVRLKGYYDSKSPKVKKINDIKFVDEYIKNYCCFGAKIFILKKIK